MRYPVYSFGLQRRLFLWATLSAIVAFSWSNTSTAEGLVDTPPSGFRQIFNGKNLDGWRGTPHLDPRQFADTSEEKKKEWNADAAKHWSVENNELVNDGHGVYLTTDEDWGDFELYIQYKTVPTADSGIYLRGNPQVQIWDVNHEPSRKLGADKGSGGLWNNSPGAKGKDPLVLADKPLGEWNQFRIRLIGERCWVWLNDKLIVDNARMENYFDRKLPLFARGPIQLQTHGGEIRWKNIYCKSIEAEEANAILKASHAQDGFRPLFNGRDLEGWKGATASYEVVDGSVQCKPGKGGALYTVQEFGDYVLQVEFQLPPAGNNGLVMRYPDSSDGKSDGAYAGMCELQVLDDGHPQYAKIDPRQAHGSAYGMVPAHRGFLRPTGQWNYQIVTVQGSKVQVELNGSRILDADLDTVKEFMANSPHPGKDLKRGHVGLAGHSDPVKYRTIDIKPLD